MGARRSTGSRSLHPLTWRIPQNRLPYPTERTSIAIRACLNRLGEVARGIHKSYLSCDRFFLTSCNRRLADYLLLWPNIVNNNPIKNVSSWLLSEMDSHFAGSRLIVGSSRDDMKLKTRNLRASAPTGARQLFLDGSAELTREELAPILHVRAVAGGPVILATQEMVSELILRGMIGPGAEAGPSARALRPINGQPGLIPYGKLADLAIQLYQDSGHSRDCEKLCLRYLSFAQDKMDVPGLETIRLLMYFFRRGPSPMEALEHLLASLASALIQGPSFPIVPQMLNDLGVLMLLYFNCPREAVLFFEASVRHGCAWTSAGLDNLRLIATIARQHRVALPGLKEALDRSEQLVRAERARPPGPSLKDRPHPTKDNWAWYLNKGNVKPAMLSQADASVEERCRAAELVTDSLRAGSREEGVVLLTMAAEILPVLEAPATIALDDLEGFRKAAERQYRHVVFQAEAAQAQAALQRKDFDQADVHVRNMRSAASTDLQKRAADTLVKNAVRSRASSGQMSYALADDSASTDARHKHEEPTLRKRLAEIDELLGLEDFEGALEACHGLRAFSSVSDQCCKMHLQRVLAMAQQTIGERIECALHGSSPDFGQATEALHLAGRLGLNEDFCRVLSKRILACRERALRLAVRRAMEQDHYAEAAQLIHHAGPEVREVVLNELSSELASQWQRYETVRRWRSSEGFTAAAQADECKSHAGIPPVSEGVQLVAGQAPPQSVGAAVEACLQAYRAFAKGDSLALARALVSLQALIGSAPIIQSFAAKCRARASAGSNRTDHSSTPPRGALRILSLLRTGRSNRVESSESPKRSRVSSLRWFQGSKHIEKDQVEGKGANP